ncbi:38928_t:CDS:2 [Gigaspora margarita]|uniref:38928_t:CDS:1 n=1 Tax=Gigaspora margarita TaxID=4874 RepID=A0ABN7VE24_GIGMA|nr:38928_t:CDS:2 [Gigaspora margarita]
MTSSASVESKQTISSHAPSLISIPTLPTIVSQQTELIINPGQLLAPDDKAPSPNTEVLILVSKSTTISSKEILEEMEIDLNLDTALATSTIESDGLPNTYSQVVSSSQTP